MGRAPCCDKANVKKGPWSPEEDAKLKEFIEKFGTGGNWIALPQKAGLKRCGKSCRLRWLNYLRPNIKHGEFSDEEDRIISTLYASIGSRWSIIAAQLPGRTDNDIKNYWNTKLKKKLMGINIIPSKFPQPLIFSGHTLEAQLSQPALSSLVDQSNVSAPQNINFMSSNCDDFSLSTTQYSNYYQEGNFHYYPAGKSDNNNNNMLIFGGNNETSCCTSSSDGSCSQISYGGKDHNLRHVKQEDQMVGCNLDQGFLSENYQNKFLNHGNPLFVDQKANGITNILPNRELGCDLEEVKQLVSSNNCNSLFFNHDDDENYYKTHEKMMYYYY